MVNPGLPVSMLLCVSGLSAQTPLSGPDYVARVIVMTAHFYAESAQYDKLAAAMTELAALDNERHSSNLSQIMLKWMTLRTLNRASNTMSC